MSGVWYSDGTDEDFTHPLGKDCVFGGTNGDGETYRIVKRVNLLVDNRKYFLLSACNPDNPVKTRELDISEKDNLTVVDCPTAIQNVWSSVKYDGDFSKTSNFIRNEIFSRCDVQNRPVTMKIEDGVFKLDFDGTIFTKERS